MSRLAELRARLDALRGPASLPDLETLLTSPEYFGLTTATPLQRAICRVADGLSLGELAKHPHVIAAMGDVSSLPRVPPHRLVWLAGIRGAKSMTAAAGAIRMAMRCDVTKLKPGESPRVSVVSTKIDLAHVVFKHLVGNILAQPRLKALLIGDPTSDSLELRHPSGRAIEVKVVAASRAGDTLISRWSAGCIFDEAPRMVGDADGVVNLDDMRSAVAGRLLDGAFIWEIGSPWAPFGPIFETVMKHEGHPSADVVVVRAQAPWLNPVYWTPKRCADLLVSNPTAYRTDVEAQFADPEEALIPLATIEACTRPEMVEEYREGHSYAAAMDPGTRGNAWTLVIATRREGKRIVVKVRQWQGSSIAPLKPDLVLREIAEELRNYRLDMCETDQWSGDALQVIARAEGISLNVWPSTQAENTEWFLELARRMASFEVVLPPDPVLRSDLLRTRKRVTQTGVAITLPLTADGRHCDYAPALARVVRSWLDEPKVEATRAPEDVAALERLKQRYASKDVPLHRRRY